jgi:hypothetical protein
MPEDAALYRSIPFETYSIDGVGVAVVKAFDGLTRQLPAADIRYLERCRQFRTLSEHAKSITSAALARASDSSVVQQLIRLRDQGYLLSAAQYFASPSRTTQVAPTQPLNCLALPTADRSVFAARAIRSYVKNARRHGRCIRVFAADGTRSSEGCRETLRRTSVTEDVEVVYAGHAEKTSYARRLARSANVPESLVSFALFGAGWPGEAIGANRNTILLHSVGQRVLCVDDDTVCRPVTAPTRTSSSLTFNGVNDPAQTWFYRSRRDVLGSARVVDVDVIGAHEQLLGWPIRAVIKRNGVENEKAFGGACDHLLNSLALGKGTIIATLNGVAGDSAFYSGEALVLSDCIETRGRMLSSEASFTQAMTTREVIRHATRTTIAHGGPFMSTHLGLDGCALLPPFMPLYRGEDTVFASMVYACVQHAYWAHLPWALLHAPRGARSNVLDAYRRIRVSDIVLQLLQSWCSTFRRPEPMARLRSFGRYLISIADLPLQSFSAVIRDIIRTSALESVRLKGAVIARHGAAPFFWANELRYRMKATLESLSQPPYFCPADIGKQDSGDEVTIRLASFLHEYGNLLDSWPSIVAAACDLKASGDTIGERL